jgi:general secretion pathway protein G
MSFWILKRKRDGKKYFYLIDPEFFTLLLIVSLLFVLVAPRLFSKLDRGKHATAKEQIELLGQALDQVEKDIGRYPTTTEGLDTLIHNPGMSKWHGPYLQRNATPNDPWGRPYNYESPGKRGDYDLYSYGADGLPGGEGINRDIVSWQ